MRRSRKPVADRQTDDRRGATAVEFALVLPMFLLFLTSAFEFGWMYVIRHTADNAAYEAARVAMVPGANAADAEREARRLLASVGTNGARINVSPGDLDEDTELVTVTIEVPFSDNALLIPTFLKNAQLQSRARLKTERYQF